MTDADELRPVGSADDTSYSPIYGTIGFDDEDQDIAFDDGIYDQAASSSDDSFSLDRVEQYRDEENGMASEAWGDGDSDPGEGHVSNLLANQKEFSRLELDDCIDNMDEVIHAIKGNSTVRDVSIHIEAMVGLTKSQKYYLADAICCLPELRSLLVYKSSLSFLEPLSHRRPWLLNSLRLCKLDISDDRKVALLVSSVMFLPNLRTLDLGFDCRDNKRVLGVLTKLRPKIVELECLRLDYKVPDDALLCETIVSEVMDTVQGNKSLKTISLPPFGCSNKSHDAIIQMLKNNMVVERIDYWFRISNLYFPDHNEVIDFYLKLNRSGVRKLQIHDNTPPGAFLDALIAHCEETDIVYHMLSTNPSIMSLIGCVK